MLYTFDVIVPAGLMSLTTRSFASLQYVVGLPFGALLGGAVGLAFSLWGAHVLWVGLAETIQMFLFTKGALVISLTPDLRVFAYTLLHEPYHGIHHQNAGLPHSVLPQFTSLLDPKQPGERVPFISYRQALPDLIRSLGNPRTVRIQEPFQAIGWQMRGTKWLI